MGRITGGHRFCTQKSLLFDRLFPRLSQSNIWKSQSNVLGFSDSIICATNSSVTEAGDAMQTNGSSSFYLYSCLHPDIPTHQCEDMKVPYIFLCGLSLIPVELGCSNTCKAVGCLKTWVTDGAPNDGWNGFHGRTGSDLMVCDRKLVRAKMQETDTFMHLSAWWVLDPLQWEAEPGTATFSKLPQCHFPPGILTFNWLFLPAIVSYVWETKIFLWRAAKGLTFNHWNF